MPWGETLPAGPNLHSLNAAGDMKGYRPYRQTPYYRTIWPRAIPKPIRSISIWQMQTALYEVAALWHSLTAEQLATWTPLAKRKQLPIYTVFAGVNLARFANGQPLTPTNP